MLQKTLKKEVSFSGVGLHSGQKIQVTLKPAPIDTGIVFWLEKNTGKEVIALNPDKIQDTTLATTIGNDGPQLATVEHLLAALSGLNLDNVIIEIDGPEVPIMDGSATSFVFLIRSAGIKKQSAGKKVLGLKQKIIFEQNDKKIIARPYSGLKISYHIYYPHPLIQKQKFNYLHSPQNFIHDVAKARTFGFVKDIEKLQQMGKAKGGSLENAVVLDEYDVLNPEGLRFHDEFVRHKILDFLGDLTVFGSPLQGYFEVYYGGHSLHKEFLSFLYQNQELYLEELALAKDQPLATPNYAPQGAKQKTVICNP